MFGSIVGACSAAVPADRGTRPFATLGDTRTHGVLARAYLEAPMTDAERDGIRDLARWFRRRYPTPLERLAYARRA